MDCQWASVSASSRAPRCRGRSAWAGHGIGRSSPRSAAYRTSTRHPHAHELDCRACSRPVSHADIPRLRGSRALRNLFLIREAPDACLVDYLRRLVVRVRPQVSVPASGDRHSVSYSPRGSARSGPDPNLLIRSHPYGHPDPFRSVRDLGRAAARCSGKSGELEGRSSAWLPAWLRAVHDTGCRNALVLVSNIEPSTGDGIARCPAQALPRTRLLPNLVTDGFGQGRLRVYMNHAALRRQLPCGHRWA